MSRTTVIAAMKAYQAGGWKAVDVERPSRPEGTGRTLTADQEREIQRLIRDRTPDQLKMVYALWTRQAVAALIQDRYGIKLAVRTMGLYLGRWGFTPQIDLLRQLVKDAGRKIYLILDNLRVHHSKSVKAWLAEHKNEIEVFYLPSYSPELNPNEMANADLKQAVTKLAPARTKLQLVKATAKHLRSVQRRLERIKSYFQHAPVRYAA